MRSMKKMGGLVGLAVAIVALTGASTASAVQITPAGTAFTASSTGEHVFSVRSSSRLRCNQAKFTGTTTNPASASVAIAPAYGTATGVSGAWCRMYEGGLFSAATITTSAPWSFTASTYGSGSSTGTVVTSGSTTITIGTCVITLPSGTNVPIGGVDDDPTGMSPGLTVTATGIGMPYTSSGCAFWGIPTSGTTAAYTGSVYVANLWAM